MLIDVSQPHNTSKFFRDGQLFSTESGRTAEHRNTSETRGATHQTTLEFPDEAKSATHSTIRLVRQAADEILIMSERRASISSSGVDKSLGFLNGRRYTIAHIQIGPRLEICQREEGEREREREG